MKSTHIHLVSDSTAETVSSVARAVLAQFDGFEPEEHVWPLIRSKGQMEKVLSSIKENPGVVLYTLVNKELRRELKKTCQDLGIPCIHVLDRVITEVSSFLGVRASPLPGKQHELDDEYFSRVEAVNFTLTHDDGQSTWDLEEADIVIIGVSRTSKSPTCMYLAHRGYRAANIPFVSGCPLPPNLEEMNGPFVVGLTLSPETLVQIRKNRLLSINESRDTHYTDIDAVKAEMAEAKRLFARNNWPVIDATRRSVEETAATIIQWYQEEKEKRSRA